MSEYSTFYESSVDMSGLPDLPSLVRINRDAIGITQTKYIEIGNLTTQVLGTGKVSWFSFNLYNGRVISAVTLDATVFLTGRDGTLARVTTSDTVDSGVFSHK